MTGRVAIALTLGLCLAAPVVAQTGRAVGTVKDQGGKAIRGAVIHADNPSAYPRLVTATTDDHGRWAMVGLGITGQWRFTAEAPGFAAASGAVQVRSAGTPPLDFVLARDPGPIPGALDKNIQQQVAEANALRDQGRLDQALAAYQDIRKRNDKLTSVHLLIADAYRRKASGERDTAAKAALLQQAIASYDELLKIDGTNTVVRAELDSTRAELSQTTR